MATLKQSTTLRIVFALLFATSGTAFLGPASFSTRVLPKTQLLFNSADDFADIVEDVVDAISEPFDRAALKQKLIKYGASYNRGFGASSTARKEADEIIEELESINDTKNATIGIEGGLKGESPLRGTWQMIWCTAPDILVLEASPLTTVGAIYQVYEPPKVTNIIDLVPRAQLLFPKSVMAPSLFRAQVTTRAFERQDGIEPENRIGLRFESVKVRAVEVLGRKSGLPPLSLDFPQLDNLDVLNPKTGPGYFDVKYLDGDLLIIEQNKEAAGGVIALLKVDDAEP